MILFIPTLSLEVCYLIRRQKPILSQDFKFIFRVIFSGHLFIICSCTLIRCNLAISAAPNTSIHMSRSLHNHLKKRSKRLLQHLLLYADAEVVELLLSLAKEGEGERGVELCNIDPS